MARKLKERLEEAAQQVADEAGADVQITLPGSDGEETIVLEPDSLEHLGFLAEHQGRSCYDCMGKAEDHYEGGACAHCARLLGAGIIPEALLCEQFVWHRQEFHGQYLVLGRELSLSGAVGIDSMGRMSREFWESLEFGARFQVLVTGEVEGDGYKPVKFRGDIVGASEVRKAKILRTIVSLGDTQEERIDELPLFAMQRDRTVERLEARLDEAHESNIRLTATNASVGTALVEALSHLTEIRAAWDGMRPVIATVQDVLRTRDHPDDTAELPGTHYDHVTRIDGLFDAVEVWEKGMEDDTQWADDDSETA